MSVKTILSIFIMLCSTLQLAWSQAVTERYWVSFRDKNNSTYSLQEPEAFLSQRALERREKQNIALDMSDLPVSTIYVDSLIMAGARIRSTSKWLNGANIETDSSEIASKIVSLSFVDTVVLSWTSKQTKSTHLKMDVDILEEIKIDTAAYGSSFRQLELNNHVLMHDLGFRGKGKLIAVLDAGFVDVDELPAFDSLRTRGQIIGTRDMVNPEGDFYDSHYHGMMVLSCMGGILPGQLMGSAPDADYFLIITEDDASEYPVEMDNWVVGAELADSIGADIINSSLGYSEFDDETMSYTYADMDGNTTRVTKAADIAASKGILVVNSAGNEGGKPWHRIIAPSDGDSVLCVGAIDQDSILSAFSSRGPSYDGRVKPNVLANGQGAVVQSRTDTPEADYISRVNGTSFASPIMAGMAACLWQAFPDKSAMDIKAMLETNSHLYNMPNDSMGYGITNIYKAYADNALSTGRTHSENITPFMYYNKLDHSLVLRDVKEASFLELYDLRGRLLLREKVQSTGLLHIPLQSNLKDLLIIGSLVDASQRKSQTLIIP